jgi:acetyl esterase/lipase
MSFTLDPEVAEALAPFAAETTGSTPPPVGDVAARRATLEGVFRYADTARPLPDDVTITDHELTTADGATIRLRWYARKDASGEPGPAALYLHGGGMIVGHVGLFDGLVSRYVSASGTPMLSVDYRLAPEHPHPVPVEDAYAALVWLHEHAADLGVDPARIGVFGDSAGGGLAAAVSILARDRKGPAIARQILVMPMLDDRTLTPDPQLAPFVVWSWDDNRTGWQALLGNAAGGPDTPSARRRPGRAAPRLHRGRPARHLPRRGPHLRPPPRPGRRPGRVPPPPRRPARVRLRRLRLGRRPARHRRPRARPRLPVTRRP